MSTRDGFMSKMFLLFPVNLVISAVSAVLGKYLILTRILGIKDQDESPWTKSTAKKPISSGVN